MDLISIVVLFFFFSSLAALGLIENNAPNITAAMLVSPLMGPVMSITFGAMISDRTLVVHKNKIHLLFEAFHKSKQKKMKIISTFSSDINVILQNLFDLHTVEMDISLFLIMQFNCGI